MGIAIYTGMTAEKRQLASDLRALAQKSIDLGLWVNGQQFATFLGDLAHRIEETTNR